MFELAGLFVILALFGVLFVAFALLAGLFKLVFKIALFPVALAFGAAKLVLVLVAVAVGLAVLGPVLFVAGVFLLPLALLGGLAWVAISAVT